MGRALKYIIWGALIAGFLAWLFLRPNLYNNNSYLSPLPLASHQSMNSDLQQTTTPQDQQAVGTNLENTDLILEKNIKVNFDSQLSSSEAESEWGQTYKKVVQIQNLSNTPTKYNIDLQSEVHVQGLVFRAEEGMITLGDVFIDEKNVLLKNKKIKTLYPGDWVSLTDVSQLRNIQLQIHVNDSNNSKGGLTIYAQVINQ